MVAVFFNPTPTAHQMFDLISEEHSLRCLPWDVWCWRSELVVVQAGWRWGIHHYHAPHSIFPPSDKFKEFAKQHLLKNPDFPAAVCYISSTLLKFPGIKEEKKKSISGSAAVYHHPLAESCCSMPQISFTTVRFFLSCIYWSPALPCQYLLVCETFPRPPSFIHYSSLSSFSQALIPLTSTWS